MSQNGLEFPGYDEDSQSAIFEEQLAKSRGMERAIKQLEELESSDQWGPYRDPLTGNERVSVYLGREKGGRYSLRRVFYITRSQQPTLEGAQRRYFDVLVANPPRRLERAVYYRNVTSDDLTPWINVGARRERPFVPILTTPDFLKPDLIARETVWLRGIVSELTQARYEGTFSIGHRS